MQQDHTHQVTVTIIPQFETMKNDVGNNIRRATILISITKANALVIQLSNDRQASIYNYLIISDCKFRVYDHLSNSLISRSPTYVLNEILQSYFPIFIAPSPNLSHI